VATVRGAFTYRVDDAGLITNLRGFWNMDAMEFGQAEGGGN
jgi:steroid delta-isomerase